MTLSKKGKVIATSRTHRLVIMNIAAPKPPKPPKPPSADGSISVQDFTPHVGAWECYDNKSVVVWSPTMASTPFLTYWTPYLAYITADGGAAFYSRGVTTLYDSYNRHFYREDDYSVVTNQTWNNVPAGRVYFMYNYFSDADHPPVIKGELSYRPNGEYRCAL
jgi:hypothetical protein